MKLLSPAVRIQRKAVTRSYRNKWIPSEMRAFGCALIKASIIILQHQKCAFPSNTLSWIKKAELSIFIVTSFLCQGSPGRWRTNKKKNQMTSAM